VTTKTFCDGCDRQISGISVERVTVTYGEQQNNPKMFDLCTPCLNNFNNGSLPTAWPRHQAKSK
jgi:hypothetical protein